MVDERRLDSFDQGLKEVAQKLPVLRLDVEADVRIDKGCKTTDHQEGLPQSLADQHIGNGKLEYSRHNKLIRHYHHKTSSNHRCPPSHLSQHLVKTRRQLMNEDARAEEKKMLVEGQGWSGGLPCSARAECRDCSPGVCIFRSHSIIPSNF